MTTWTLRLKQSPEFAIDGSSIDARELAGKSKSMIESMKIGADCLGDWFDVVIGDRGEGDRIELIGDLSNFHHIGANHQRGEIHVDGNVGDFVGAAVGGRRLGMTGGRIVVVGNAGPYAGHRMRRGEIWIGGDCGRLAAAHMVAGSIMVAGQVGADSFVGMQRGSFFASRLPKLASGRFTRPLESFYLLASLIRPPKTEVFESFWKQFRITPVISVRGDRAVGGQGEIVAPAAG